MARSQINLKLSPEQKARWEDFAESNPEPDSLSHLIRMGVETYMARGTGGVPSHRKGEVTADAETSGETQEMFNEIRNSLDSLNDRVGAIERDTSSNAQIDLQRVAYEMLPYGRGGSDHDRLGATEIAQRIGAEPSRVREVLEDLSDGSTIVMAERIDAENRTVYYRTSQ
ncbi:hypothetical protein [Halococcus agarilyticus]|uniref:hypothetical protein n=1 Tax=Halococcus agarilyticus TaxID=1232219 RepID=UPI0006778469|nr:hypothetical protein [Halococcus agarilyticus]